MRDGSIWLIAAGAANTFGKGGPWEFSRAVCPVDGGNSRTWAWEVANAGTGVEPWPQVQIDSYFAATLEMNRRFGNLPDDVCTHAAWTNFERKIDPAPAAAVEGPWQPRACTSAGTWDLDDIRAELRRRAGDENGDDMPLSDDDVDRIADAVFKRVWTDVNTTDPPTGKACSHDQLLGWARHAAANADKQTKP
jgi:hypothetical protein